MVKTQINVGITINVEDFKTSNFFSNGIKQNVITLREVYENCKNVGNSYIINTHKNKSDPVGTSWEEYAKYFITKEEAKDKCDLIVVCQGSLHVEEYEEYKKLGKKIVKQILGAELAIFNERNLFDIPAGGIYKRNNNVDAVWLSPHFYERDKHFFKAIYNNCETHLAPYIWDPRFINAHVETFKNSRKGFSGVYVPKNEKAKRISTMEANLNIVKTCSVPIIITELFYRKHPELLNFFSVFGGENIKKKSDMIDFVKNMDINQNKKCFFENRYPTPFVLFDHTDIVLSHQNQCELNYLYLDTAWLGYPVVHNSPMMKELGWYYPENDADTAIEHIKYIAENFDTAEHPNEKYLNKSREYASQFLPSNSKNIQVYETLINRVMKVEKRVKKK